MTTSTIQHTRASFPRLALLMLPFFGLIAALFIIEIAFRLISKLEEPRDPAADRPRFFYAHAHAPSMQDYPFEVPKPVGEYRIAVVGDSFTFGTAMQVDSTFPKKLERLLQASVLPNARVINYGVPGYSVGNEIGMAKIALAHGADLLIHQITLNDPQKKELHPTGLQYRNQFALPQFSRTTQQITSYWTSLGFLMTRFHNRQTQKNYINFYYDLFDSDRSWEYFRIGTKRIRHAARDAKKPVLGVIFPLFGLPLDNNYPFASLHEKIASLFEKKQRPYLDLLETYRGIPLDRIQVIPGKDFHPNEIGHRLAAEAMYNYLIENTLIPITVGTTPLATVR